jgi:hypothetical protein
MTLEEYKANHKKLWQAVIEEMEEQGICYDSTLKRVVYEKVFPDQPPVRFYCFACDYAKFTNGFCFLLGKNCPGGLYCLGGLYDKLELANTIGNAIALAKQIRDLEPKEVVNAE